MEKVLKALKRTDYDNLRAKWLPVEQVENALNLSLAEQQWLQQHQQIRLLIDPSWAPIEYIDNDGRFKGISIDYLKKLEMLLGIKFDYPADISWSDGIRMFRDKKLDMASSVAKTAERAEYSIFTEPYISIPISIFAGKDVSYVGNMDSLSDKRVAVISGYAITEWIKRDYPDLDLRLVETLQEGLKLVSAGEVDVFSGNIVTTTYYIGKYNLTDVRQAGVTPYANAQRMAVRDDWPELKSILQKALNAIPKAEKQEIYNKWMGLQFERTVDYRLVWMVLIVSSIIIFAVFYWNRKLKEAMRLAEIANEEKSRFLSNMSHELRTPMHAILSFSSLGIKKSHDDRAVAYFDKIHISGQRLTRLLDDLLDLSKLEAGKMIADFRPHDMGTLTRGCIESIEALSRDHHVKIGFINTGIIKGDFDAKLISQVIINLLSNAIKFSPANSKVDIQIEQLDNDNGRIIQFSIRDEGVGIPQNELKDVFNSFVQSSKTRSSKGGTGLGLPISKEIIELHHGKIWVDSPPREASQGTEVIFQIPEKQLIAN